jgi:hypothetical protein
MAVYNAHLMTWDTEDGRAPEIAGPIELYRPIDDGTEELPPDANFEAEFHGEFETIEDAIAAIDCVGRWPWSRPDAGHYLGHINSLHGSRDVVTY